MTCEHYDLQNYSYEPGRKAADNVYLRICGDRYRQIAFETAKDLYVRMVQNLNKKLDNTSNYLDFSQWRLEVQKVSK